MLIIMLINAAIFYVLFCVIYHLALDAMKFEIKPSNSWKVVWLFGGAIGSFFLLPLFFGLSILLFGILSEILGFILGYIISMVIHLAFLWLMFKFITLMMYYSATGFDKKKSTEFLSILKKRRECDKKPIDVGDNIVFFIGVLLFRFIMFGLINYLNKKLNVPSNPLLLFYYNLFFTR